MMTKLDRLKKEVKLLQDDKTPRFDELVRLARGMGFRAKSVPTLTAAGYGKEWAAVYWDGGLSRERFGREDIALVESLLSFVSFWGAQA